MSIDGMNDISVPAPLATAPPRRRIVNAAQLMQWRDKLTWYAYRLRAMGPREIGYRLTEQWAHRSDARLAATVETMPFAGTVADFPRLPDRGLCPAPLLRRVAADATHLLAGDWQLFGWREVNVGAPPCWHRDATCGVVISPKTLAFRLDHRHLHDGADARTIWEINRWAEMARLAMHGWLNADFDTVRTAQLWLEDWCDRNPAGFGINWTSPLEAALRLINFTWFDALVHACGSAELLARQRELAARIVPVHAMWVWRYRSFGSSANNHLLGELAGLIVAGRRWPEVSHFASCPERVWQMISVEILSQFADDGGSHEQALHYHLFAWEMAWHAALAAGDVDEEVWMRLTKAGDYFATLAQGDEPWDFGDSDDAQITPFAASRAEAVQEWLGWLRGNDRGAAVRFWLGPPPRVAAGATIKGWRVFSTSGQACAKMGRWTVRVDASPLGYGTMAAHGHLDALHVSIWQAGRAVIVDPGTGAYYGNAALRTRLASWQAHNGPVPVRGRPNPKRMGPFLWHGHHAQPHLEVDGDRCAMSYADDGGFVKRFIDRLEDGITVRDEVRGNQPHQVTWQLSPRWQVVSRRGDPGEPVQLRLEHESGLALQMTLASPAMQAVEIIENPVSPRFGQVVQAPAIRVLFRTSLTTSWLCA